MRDEDFQRGRVPMTKSEVRVLTMADFELARGMRFLDIGAGTGSISIAAASLGSVTSACEYRREAIDLIRENAEKFGVSIRLIEGRAPDCLDDVSYDRIFIGGSDGHMEAILAYAHRHLARDGIVGGNFVTLANAEAMRRFLKERGYETTTRYIAVSREDTAGILRAENGVFMVRGKSV
ncbi:MAG: precorrin-6Y C5,15-methyltransferase (decarboxylating) subunit CbiT [Peptoniphilus sp.]|nr:precorrin-6Y C5,15-methyltransferase (decarboxylating) subunit CbiT [Peptoniphilus sp.]MDD7363719.1 precorrin-6Y C5,15-methyltransferase (decarboxylating) subunit CbiT [Bacillota bacterium]MDY6044104.1 precorrin-6Y C5,15-methyltransferase (decarboxylating) subunit CbiT [Peptoniphilus sp.]